MRSIKLRSIFANGNHQRIAGACRAGARDDARRALTRTAKFTTPRDTSRTFLANAGVNYDLVDGTEGTSAVVKIGAEKVTGYDAKAPSAKQDKARFEKQVRTALSQAGCPANAYDG